MQLEEGQDQPDLQGAHDAKAHSTTCFLGLPHLMSIT